MDAFVIRDTHKFIGTLEQHGFSVQQAEGIAKAMREFDTNAVATKLDLRDLKVDLIKWMVGTHLAYSAIVIGVLAAIL